MRTGSGMEWWAVWREWREWRTGRETRARGWERSRRPSWSNPPGCSAWPRQTGGHVVGSSPLDGAPPPRVPHDDPNRPAPHACPVSTSRLKRRRSARKTSSNIGWKSGSIQRTPQTANLSRRPPMPGLPNKMPARGSTPGVGRNSSHHQTCVAPSPSRLRSRNSPEPRKAPRCSMA